MKSAFYILSFFVLASCSLNSDPTGSVFQPVISDYNVSTGQTRVLKTFDPNSLKPYIRYFNNSNRLVAAQYTKFYFFEEDGSETFINTDTVLINDGYYFDIAPDNSEIIFSGTAIVLSNDAVTTYRNRGLYKLNISTNKVSRYLIDDDFVAQYPSYSKDGSKVVYTLNKRIGNDTKVMFMNADKTGKTEVDASASDVLRHGKFANDGASIFYLLATDRILQYDIAAKTRTIISHSGFTADEVTIDQFPSFNLNNNALYYYSYDGGGTSSSIYKYDLATKTGSKLFEGVNILSVTANNLIFRAPVISLDLSSDIMLYNGTTQKMVGKGNKACLSDSETSVAVMIIAEQAK